MKNKLFFGLALCFVALLTLAPAKATAQVPYCYYYGSDTGMMYGGSSMYSPSFGYGSGWVGEGGYYRGGHHRGGYRGSGYQRSGYQGGGYHHGRR